MALRFLTLVMVAGILFFSAFFAGTQLSSRSAQGLEPLSQSAFIESNGEPIAEVLSDQPGPIAEVDSTHSTIVDRTEPPTNETSSSTTPPRSSTSTSTTAAPIPTGLDPAFAPIHDELIATVDVPVRLPRSLPDLGVQLIAAVETIDPNGYTIHLGDGSNCHGSATCQLLTFTARRSPTVEPSPSSVGIDVPLPTGGVGQFFDATCSTECTNSFVTWTEQDVQYTVGTHQATGRETLDLAWRSIGSTFPTPADADICGSDAATYEGLAARTLTTRLGFGGQLHWLAVCSEAETVVELVSEPGEVQWLDLDRDGVSQPAVRHRDGTVSLFALIEGVPRPAMDLAAGRLRIGALGCGDVDEDGGIDAIDLVSDEQLHFISPVSIERVNLEPSIPASACV